MARPKRNAASTEPSGDLNPFLKTADVREGDKFKLSGWVREASGAYGPQIILEGTLERTSKVYDFSIGRGSQNHKTMFKAHGADIHKWIGTIDIAPAPMRNGQGSFIKIVDAGGIPF